MMSIQCKFSSKADSEREFLYSLPYPSVSKKDRDFLTRGQFEDDMRMQLKFEDYPEYDLEVDPEQAPYSYVYQDKPDHGWFTKTESIIEKEPERWFWVERLLPNHKESPHLNLKATELPSGYNPQPFVPPDLPYFVNRTRSGLYPVYKQIYFSESRPTTTVVNHVIGNLWKFEQDLHDFFRKHDPDFDYEAGVNEAKGQLTIRGNCVMTVVDFLKAQGF